MAYSPIDIRPSMVFPTTKMNPVNKLITEGNLTKLINNLIDMDSYIVPPQFDLSRVTWQENLGTLIEIHDIILGEQSLEFLIHGYYFKLPLNTASAIQNGNKLLAKIVIDKSHENYPELFGERSVSDIATVNVAGQVVLGETTLDVNFRDKDISRVYVTSSGQQYDLLIDENWVLQPLNSSTPAGPFNNGYTIEYYSYHILLNLYEVPVDTNPNEIEFNSLTLGNIPYEEYNLEILYKINSKLYLPMNNFPKFTSRSILNIDGGII